MPSRGPSGVLLGRELPGALPPQPALPAGYRRRRWQPDDDQRLPPLLGEAFGPQRGSYAALEETLRRFPGIEPRGIMVVESSERTVVATASARLDPDDTTRGWIHLVAVRSEHERRGLGTAVVLAVLQHLIECGAVRACVGTRAHRLAAIRLYLRLGFEPIINDDSTPVAWAEVRSVLNAQAGPSTAGYIARIDAALRRRSSGG